jgi:ketosteroid isomerase-like protein
MGTVLGPLLGESVFRRLYPYVLLRGYEDFNRLGAVPHAVFAEDFQLYQAAELLGTVGTFHGPTALDQVVAELRESFEDVHFVPHAVTRINEHRLVVVVRFMGTGGGSGIPVDHLIAHLWTRRGFRASRLEVYWETAEAFEALEQGP